MQRQVLGASLAPASGPGIQTRRLYKEREDIAECSILQSRVSP